MIRRFREHAATQNWFAVALDFAIVVLGVFLGIQVNNWNQMRIDRNKGAEYRERLSDELRTTESVMRGLQAYADAAKKSGQAALMVLDDARAPASGTFLFDAYQASQVVPRAGRHATYDEIVESGALDKVGPPALRDEISNFYWRMDGILSLDAGSSPYREKLREAMPNAVQEIIRARCDERLVDAGDGLVIASLPDRCDPEIKSAVVSKTVSRLRAEPGLAHLLNRQLSALDARSFNYAKLAVHARHLRQAIAHY